MRSKNLYTKRLSGLDYRVWITLLLTCLICMGFYGYWLIHLSRQDHQPLLKAAIIVNGVGIGNPVVCATERLVFLRIENHRGGEVRWNFDDGSTPEKGETAAHRFFREGVYQVSATIDGRYKIIRALTITNPVSLKPEKTYVEIYADADSVTAGRQLRFWVVSNILEETYQWKVLGTKDVQTNSVAAFTFRTPGRFMLQLMLNNDSTKTALKTIEVTAMPQSFPDPAAGMGAGSPNPSIPRLLEPGVDYQNGGSNQPKQTGSVPGPNAGTVSGPAPIKPEPPKVVDIAPETFKSMLQEYLNEEKEVTDLNQYLHLKETTMVKVNDGRSLINIVEFRKQYREKKIVSLSFIRNDKNEISTINVKVKGRGIFGKFRGK